MKSVLHKDGTSDTFTTSIPFTPCSARPSKLEYEDTNMRLNPKRAASIIRRSVCATGLTSPLRPISPAKQTSEGVAKSKLEEKSFFVPPIELQEQFAAFVEQTDKSKLAIQRSLDELETLIKTLMQKYFG